MYEALQECLVTLVAPDYGAGRGGVTATGRHAPRPPLHPPTGPRPGLGIQPQTPDVLSLVSRVCVVSIASIARVQ